MVSRENQKKDTIKQLLCRITKYVYHYKQGEEHRFFVLAGEWYIDFDQLKEYAIGEEWMQVDDERLPFD